MAETSNENMKEVQKSIVKLFEDKQIRIIWQEESEEFYFCVNDVIVALTGSENPNNYLKQLRHRDSELSEGWLQIVPPLFWSRQLAVLRR